MELANRYPKNEIDLRDLLLALWAERLLIVLVTLVVVLVAAAYVFLISPVYEARSSLLPPRQSDIAGYNLGRTAANLSEFKVADVYAIFTRNLTSQALKRRFFSEVYLPSLPEGQRSRAQDVLWRDFNEQLAVKVPDIKNRPDYFEVRIEHEDPELAADWVNRYVERAAELARKDMQQIVLQEIKTRAQEIERRIEGMRESAVQQREDRIARLREALLVADEVGMSVPLVTPGRTASDGELSSYVDGSLMYMLGGKAIRAELQVLENRQSDDPFIEGLRDLQSQLVFLKGIEVLPDNVAVASLDSIAEVPETPIRPKRGKTLVVAMLLGGLLGMFIALVRRVVRRDPSLAVS